MDTPTDPAVEIASESPKAPLITPIIDYKARNEALIRDYTSGMTPNQIVNKYEVSKVRMYQILKSNKDLVSVCMEEEKVRRHRQLRKVEDKTSKDLAPKNVIEYVAILEAQRKNLDGDKPTSINIDNRSVNLSMDAELVASIAGIKSMYAMLLTSKGMQVNTINIQPVEPPKPYSLIDRQRELKADRVNNAESKTSTEPAS